MLSVFYCGQRCAVAVAEGVCVRRPQIEQVAMVLAHISDKELKTNEYANFLHYVRVLS